MKVFISHAVLDRELASRFVDLLQLGIGISRDLIFFSSYPGSIPNGEYFVGQILRELNEAQLVIAILSTAYLESQFCVAEVGAALARREQSKASFYSLVVPPEKLSELGGVLYARQTGYLTDLTALDQLRSVIQDQYKQVFDDSTWGNRSREFVEHAARLVRHRTAESLAKRLILRTMEIDRAPASASEITYKLKLRVILRNDTGETLRVGPVTWKSGNDRMRLQTPPLSPLPLQVETDLGWQDAESATMQVPDAREFRTWIGMKDNNSDKEFLNRHVEKRLGELIVPLDFSGETVIRRLSL